MTGDLSVCVLGGPDSGKSTFIGAVATALDDGQTKLFEMGVLPANASGLDRLQAPLLGGRYPQRTQKGEQPELRMNLHALAPLPDRSVTLSIVDYAGETVERLFHDRTRGWTPEWQTRATADGLLLVIRPPAVQPLPRLRRAVGGDGADPSDVARVFGESGLRLDESPVSLAARRDDPVRMPTELALIELLQFLRHARGLAPGERPPVADWRIGVMLSAWDDVSADWRKEGPRAYLEQEFSLLEDYLWSNFRPHAVQRFGLSSTGGDLKDEAISEKYRRGALSGYVTWTGSGGAVKETPDVALPLAWSLFGDAAFEGLGAD